MNEPIVITDAEMAKFDPDPTPPAAAPAAPPAEPAAETPTPAAPAPAKPAEPPAAEEPDDVVTAQDILREIRETRAEITKPAPAATPAEPTVPAHIQEMIDSTDPLMQSAGRELLDSREREATMQARLDVVEGNIGAREAAEVETEITTGVEKYALNQAQEAAVVHYMLSSPEVARTKTFEQGINAMFPDLAPVGTNGGRPGGKSPAPSQTPATIVEPGGGPPTPAKPWAPGPGDTMESVINKGAASLLGVRG